MSEYADAEVGQTWRLPRVRDELVAGGMLEYLRCVA
jgi:hypothetical protein